MLVQIHNVVDWDITSKVFDAKDDCEAFEMRKIIIRADKETLQIDMFLKREKESD